MLEDVGEVAGVEVGGGRRAPGQSLSYFFALPRAFSTGYFFSFSASLRSAARERIDAEAVGELDEEDQHVGDLVLDFDAGVSGGRLVGLLGRQPLEMLDELPASATSAMARFFGLWNWSQSRSATKTRSRLRRMSRLVDACHVEGLS